MILIGGQRSFTKWASFNPSIETGMSMSVDSSEFSKRIWREGAEQFLIATLDPPVTIAGHRVEPLNVQNGDATSANLNKARILEGARDQIDGGSLHSEHLPEEFLCQPDVVASQPLSALE